LELDEVGLGENVIDEALAIHHNPPELTQIRNIISLHNSRTQYRRQVELALIDLTESSLEKLCSVLKSAETNAKLTKDNDSTVSRALISIQQLKDEIATRERLAQEAIKALEAEKVRLEDEEKQRLAQVAASEAHSIELDRLRQQLEQAERDTEAIAKDAKIEEIEVELDDLKSLDAAAAAAVTAELDLQTALLPPPIASDSIASAPTITIPIFASATGGTIESPRSSRRPGSSIPTNLFASLNKATLPKASALPIHLRKTAISPSGSPMPSPRIIIKKTIIQEEPPNPEKDAIYESLLMTMSIEPHALYPGVQIANGNITVVEPAKSALTTANAKAALVRLLPLLTNNSTPQTPLCF